MLRKPLSAICSSCNSFIINLHSSIISINLMYYKYNYYKHTPNNCAGRSRWTLTNIPVKSSSDTRVKPAYHLSSSRLLASYERIFGQGDGCWLLTIVIKNVNPRRISNIVNYLKKKEIKWIFFNLIMIFNVIIGNVIILNLDCVWEIIY